MSLIQGVGIEGFYCGFLVYIEVSSFQEVEIERSPLYVEVSLFWGV